MLPRLSGLKRYYPVSNLILMVPPDGRRPSHTVKPSYQNELMPMMTFDSSDCCKLFSDQRELVLRQGEACARDGERRGRRSSQPDCKIERVNWRYSDGVIPCISLSLCNLRRLYHGDHALFLAKWDLAYIVPGTRFWLAQQDAGQPRRRPQFGVARQGRLAATEGTYVLGEIQPILLVWRIAWAASR